MLRSEFGKLARLRREQGYDIEEILIEFEILGDILYDALREGGAEVRPPGAARLRPSR